MRFIKFVLVALLILFVVVWCSPAEAQTVSADRFRLNTGPCMIRSGSGSPESVVTGNVCDTYINTANGQIYTKWTGTGNTGWKVGFQDTATTQTMQTSNYASQTTGYQLTSAGALDVRYLYTDELRAKLFSAEEEAVYRSSLMVTKSHSEVSQTFTCPSAGATSTLWVKDAATLGDARVFAVNDWVVIRNYARTDADADGNQELAITDCVGQVSAYADGSGANAGQQSWTFTRGSGGSAGAMTASTTVAVGNAVLDFGVSGNGVGEINAYDGSEGVNAPYFQTKTWTTSPVAANFAVTTRLGNIGGITTASGDNGLIAGNGDFSFGGKFIIASSIQGVLLRNTDLSIYNGGTQVIRLEDSTPALAIGNPMPSAYGTGTGIWMGNDGGTYKFRVGVPSGAGIFWDGTALTVRGTAGSTRNFIRNADCQVSTTGWTLGSNTGLVSANFGLDPWDLNNEGGTCYLTESGTPANGTVSYFQSTVPYPVVAGSRYEMSAYLGAHGTASGAYVQINFYDTPAGTTLIGSLVGNDCQGGGTGGYYLVNYCRSGVIGTAPTGSNVAYVYIVRTYNGTYANPYLFFTHALFGEATSTQTELSSYGHPGVTSINGGLVETDTLTANHIAANAITTSELAADSVTSAKIVAGTIVASDIATGTITATQIAADTITAAEIATFNLSSISANIGTITAGSISGVTATFGSSVTLDSSGITLDSGTGTDDGYKFESNTYGTFFDTSVNVIYIKASGGFNFERSGAALAYTSSGLVSNQNENLGSSGSPWGNIFLSANINMDSAGLSTTTSADYPLVYSTGNELIYRKTDGFNGSCNPSIATSLVIERGIVVDCS